MLEEREDGTAVVEERRKDGSVVMVDEHADGTATETLVEEVYVSHVLASRIMNVDHHKLGLVGKVASAAGTTTKK